MLSFIWLSLVVEEILLESGKRKSFCCSLFKNLDSDSY